MCDGGINFQQKISLSQPINQLLNLLIEDTECIETKKKKRETMRVCVFEWDGQKERVCVCENVEQRLIGPQEG